MKDSNTQENDSQSWTAFSNALDTEGDEIREDIPQEDDDSSDTEASNHDTSSQGGLSSDSQSTTQRQNQFSSDEASVEDYVERLKKARAKNAATKGTATFMAAALATSAAVKLGNLLIDEDDIVIGATAIAQAFGGGGAGGTTVGGGATAASTLPATHTVVLQQMAVGAAHNASTAAATGATGAAAAGGGAGAAGASSSTSQTAAGATVVTAVAAGVAAATLMNGVPLLCPNVMNPSLYRGQMAVDFLGMGSSLSVQQAGVLASRFLETYDEIFGCDSLYSRKMVNCSIPCDTISDIDNTTQCCDAISDSIYGDYHRCIFTCFVHCDGCMESEPFFAEPMVPTDFPFLNETQSDTIGSTGNSTQRYLQVTNQTDGIVDCSPLCMLTRAMEDLVCDEMLNATESCVVVRSFALLQDVDVNGTATEVVFNRTDVGELLTLVPFPTFSPSSTPSSIPSVMPSVLPSGFPTEVPSARPSVIPSNIPSTSPTHTPSAAPSTAPSYTPTNLPSATPTTSPSMAPTALPTSDPSARPSNGPSVSPSASPTSKPSPFPSLEPSRRPSSSPTASPSMLPTPLPRAIRDLVFRDRDGSLIGFVDQATLLADSFPIGVSVRALVSAEVTSVIFYLDGEFIFHDRWEPFHLWGDRDGIGFVYNPLTETGSHVINVIALNGRRQVDQRLFRYSVV